MNPQLKYRQASTFSWTRIDMLLMVYEKAVQSVQEGVLLLQEGRSDELAVSQMKVQRALMTIADGLNPQVDDTPAQIAQLCLFVLEQTSTRSLDAWQSSLEVMQTLHEGFVQIQDQAREAEYSGKIPALDVVSP